MNTHTFSLHWGFLRIDLALLLFVVKFRSLLALRCERAGFLLEANYAAGVVPAAALEMHIVLLNRLLSQPREN
eukprot:71760-Amphidinium_carterae.2